MNIRNVTEKDLIRALSTPCATLDKKGTVPDAQVAGQVTDVLEFATRAGFPAEGSKGKFYVDKGTGKAYEWSGTEYVESPGAPEFIRRMGVDLARKADKVANATDGNLAALDANGNLVDSGNYVNGDIQCSGVFKSGYLDEEPGQNNSYAQFEHQGDGYTRITIVDSFGTHDVYIPSKRDNNAPHESIVALEHEIAPVFDDSDTYEVGDLVYYAPDVGRNRTLYRCTTAVTSAGDWTGSTNWTPATVEDVLAALRTALAGKADASALRYAMPAAVALVAENDAATLVCADRAVTNATIATGFSTLNLTFPAAVSGYVRDFYLRITVAAGESAPAISVPQGITIENAGGAVPGIADGEASAAATTLVWFSETAPGVFTAKSETVKAVA